MAKRAPTDEAPYSPVRAALVDAVARGAGEKGTPSPPDDAQPAGGERVLQLPVSPKRSRKEKEERVLPADRPRERLEREKRVLLSRSEEAAVGELVQRLSANGAASLKLSHLLRASILILRHCEHELVERVKRATDLIRPPNDNPLALAEFEHRVAQEFAAAIRSSPPLR